MSAMTFGQKSFTPTPPDKGSFPLDHEGECKTFMLRGTHSRTLAFNAKEKFLEIGSSKDPNWVHVINENGKLGYVPKNYMTLEQVSSVEMLELIDACIEGIHLSASEKSGSYSKFEQEALQILVEKRQEWYNKIPPTMHPSKRPAPPPPCRTSSQLSVDSIGSNFSDGSLPSPCQPPPSSISTPIQATTSNLVSLPDSKITIRPQRQSSEIEIITSFIGRGNSLVSEEGSEIDVVQSPENKEQIENLVLEMPSFNMKNILSSVPNGYCKKLVEDVRSKTNISFATSQQVVTLILESLGQTFTPLSPLVQKILFDKQTNSNVESNESWESSSDGRKLVDVLEKLRQCKDDGQQRSWALHEDEFTITELLNHLLDVLTNGDLGICSEVLMIEDFRPVLTLVQYYQMETRWNLRKLLLLIFTNVCQISRKNISFLSASVLPLELTREILDPNISQEELQFTVLVLGMILSMGDTLPFTHFSIMNESFVTFLIEGVESYNSDPDTEHLGELFLTLLLAFNLQFFDASKITQENGVKDGQSENLVIKVLSRKSEYKYFIEKILILFNREEDPVCMFEHEPRPVHSVLRMMVDIFQCGYTAKLLYTNDEKVLCDIILRQLTDLPSDDKRRSNYLLLLEGVVSLGRWKEHQHRQKELTTRLNAISEQGESPCDKEIAERILQEVQ